MNLFVTDLLWSLIIDSVLLSVNSPVKVLECKNCKRGVESDSCFFLWCYSLFDVFSAFHGNCRVFGRRRRRRVSRGTSVRRAAPHLFVCEVCTGFQSLFPRWILRSLFIARRNLPEPLSAASAVIFAGAPDRESAR